MNTFGRRIRNLRQAKRYSLRALAPLVGVGFTYLSKVERGRLDFGEVPSASLIRRLALALDADEVELMLLAHRIPEAISSRIFEQPEAFRQLAECDAATIDRIVEELRFEESPIRVAKPT